MRIAAFGGAGADVGVAVGAGVGDAVGDDVGDGSVVGVASASVGLGSAAAVSATAVGKNSAGMGVAKGAVWAQPVKKKNDKINAK